MRRRRRFLDSCFVGCLQLAIVVIIGIAMFGGILLIAKIWGIL